MKKPCFQVYLKDHLFPGKRGRGSRRVCLFPYNWRSCFFCMSTRVNLPHRYTHISLWLSCVKSLLVLQLSCEKWTYQCEMGASHTLVHIIPSLLVLFPSENKLQSWSQTVEFWLRQKFLLLLLFINDNKIIMHHYLCIGWFVFRAWLWICRSLKCRIRKGAGPTKFYNLN